MFWECRYEDEGGASTVDEEEEGGEGGDFGERRRKERRLGMGERMEQRPQTPASGGRVERMMRVSGTASFNPLLFPAPRSLALKPNSTAAVGSFSAPATTLLAPGPRRREVERTFVVYGDE